MYGKKGINKLKSDLEKFPYESFPHWKRSNEGNALTFLNEKKIKILDHSESQIKVLSNRPILTIQTNSQNPF